MSSSSMAIKVELDAPDSAALKEIVLFEVGASRTKYQVHRFLLTRQSEHFEKLLNDPEKKANQELIPLHDIDVHVFNTFINWLYIQTQPGDAIFPDFKPNRDGLSGMSPADLLKMKVQAYGFGDRYLILSFCKYMTKTIQEHLKRERTTGSCPELILPAATWAFANLAADRRVLQLLANNFAEWWNQYNDDQADMDALSQFPQAFSVRVMRRLKEMLQIYGRDESPFYCYIEHASVEEKKACVAVEEGMHPKYDQEKEYWYFQKPWGHR